MMYMSAALPFALAGGYALWAHGAPESENDVDFVIAEEDTFEPSSLYRYGPRSG